MKVDKPIYKGICPICGTEIAYKNGDLGWRKKDNFDQYWIKYQDGSNADVPVCKSCLGSLTLEQAQEVQRRQRYAWGLEIFNTPLGLLDMADQIKWYIRVGVFLEVVKIARTKEGL